MSDNACGVIEQKLEYYSSLRKMVERNQELSSTEIEHHLSTMGQDLMSEDRYIAYHCQKAYVAILKSFNLQAGLVVMTEILQDRTKVKFHLLCLETGTELLTRHCKYRQLYSKHLTQPLYNYCKAVFHRTIPQIVSEHNAQCLYCVFRILYKYVKLIRIYNSSEAMTFIQAMLHEFSGVFIDILFYKDTLDYVKRKLIKLLASILQCQTVSLNEHLLVKVVSINNLLTETLMDVEMSNVISKTGVGGFTGQGDVLDQDGHQVDIVHIREWSLLVIASIALTNLKDPSRARQLMVRLDVAVKLKLGQNDDVLLSWLPEVFSDQDDAWIEVLQILMDLSSKRCITQESPWIRNHWYFLQFMAYTGFDHGILIDFLTSPETNFLCYLTSYLKHLIASWGQFKETVDLFRTRYETSTLTSKNMCKLEYKESTASSANIVGDLLLQNPDKHAPSFSTHTNDPNQEMSQLTDKMVSDNHETSTLSVNTSRASDLVGCRNNSKEVTAPKVLNGLAMISEVYSDSENSDSDDEGLFKTDHGKDDPNKDKQHEMMIEELDQSVETFELNDVHGDDGLERNILDAVMSTLIRAHLKLERLWESKVIHYNPKPLIRLLEQVERCYESS